MLLLKRRASHFHLLHPSTHVEDVRPAPEATP